MKTGFIDWKDDSLYLYIFDKKGGGYILEETGSVPLEGDFNAAALSSLIKTQIDTIYLSLPVHLLTLREQDFPFSDTDKIKDTITYELEGILLGHIDDYSIDHIIIERTAGGSRVLAVCIENTKLNGLIDICASAGLNPKVITSIDLRLSEGNIDKLFEEPVSDLELRAQAAGKELMEPSVNLRQGEHVFTGDIDRLKKKIKSTALLILIFVVILGTVSALRFQKARQDNESLTKQLHSMYSSVFPEDKKIIDVERQFKGNLNTLQKRKEILAGIPLMDIIQEIALKTGESITLTEFSSDGTNFTIRGIAKSFEEVETLRDSLSLSYTSVKVTDSNATADKKIDFTIIMKEKIS